MENAFSPVVVVPSSTASAVRPKSAGAFPSSARKLFVPTSTGVSTTRSVASPSSPFCTRYRNRPRLAGTPAKSGRPGSAAASAIRQPPATANQTYVAPTAQTVVRPRTASAGITRRVMKEEIELQRQVTQDAQKQLTALQRELSMREKEIQALQLQLNKLRGRQQLVIVKQTTCALPCRSDGNKHADATPEKGESCEDCVEETLRTQKQNLRQHEPLIPALKQQLSNHDSYKKKLRHMLDRLVRSVQVATASEELLRQQTASARREQVVFAEKLALDRNQCKDLESQKARILRDRAAFAQDSNVLLTTYRDEIATRSVVSAQRQLADRRRQNMLQLMESRPSTSTVSGPSAVHSSNLSDLVARRSNIHRSSVHHANNYEPVRRSRRRESCVLAADVTGRRESIFELYESQYERILTETGESDATRVLESFLGFAESQKRLTQIEQELVTESSRLEREREAHEVLLHHLRASGTAEVEKRKKIRDYLEHVMHERQLEKQFAKEAFGESAKLFIYIQQGVLNIAELLRCLLDFTMVSGTQAEKWLASSSAVVGKARVPVVVGATTVSEAAGILSGLVHHAQFVLRGHPSLSKPIEFTTEQIERLVKFMPEFELSRLVHYSNAPLKVTNPSDRRRNEASGSLNLSTMHQGSSDIIELSENDTSEQLDVAHARYNIKQFERETLLEVEALFRAMDARKKQQATTRYLAACLTAENNHEGQSQSSSFAACKTTPPGRSRHQSHGEDDIKANLPLSALPTSDPDKDMKEKLEAVHAFFKEKRKLDKIHGIDSRQPVHSATVTGGSDDGKTIPKSRTPSRPLGAASNAIAGLMMKRKVLVKRRSADALVLTPTTFDSTASSNSQQLATESCSTQGLAVPESKAPSSSTSKVLVPSLKRKGSTRSTRPKPFR